MTQPTTDPYAILGIPRDARERQVRQAYRRLAMRYHPDRHPDQQSSERMQRINEAWHILANPIRRRRFDSDTVLGPTPPAAGRRSWAPAWTAATRPSGASTRGGIPVEPTDHKPEDPGLPSALAIVAVAWLVLGTIFFGFLPAPIIGLALLVAARSILGVSVTR